MRRFFNNINRRWYGRAVYWKHNSDYYKHSPLSGIPDNSLRLFSSAKPLPSHTYCAHKESSPIAIESQNVVVTGRFDLTRA